MRKRKDPFAPLFRLPVWRPVEACLPPVARTTAPELLEPKPTADVERRLAVYRAKVRRHRALAGGHERP